MLKFKKSGILFPAILFMFLIAISSCGNTENEHVSLPQPHIIDSAWYLNQGQQITQAAFDSLSQTLQKAIAEQGMVDAIVFCQINAYPITASATTDEVVYIKRTALKYRNPENAPTDLERQILNGYFKSFNRGEELQSRILASGDTIHFFRPIKLMPLCANCHGPKENINPEVLSKINELYPNDKATGFAPGDLRGMWHVVGLSK
ncbi:MAG: DUF3365 domain-containing protein [Bacteroidetes bacterium]|nr:DUF3365 domain-containing protein [Bacteroidota bacterium]